MIPRGVLVPPESRQDSGRALHDRACAVAFKPGRAGLGCRGRGLEMKRVGGAVRGLRLRARLLVMAGLAFAVAGCPPLPPASGDFQILAGPIVTVDQPVDKDPVALNEAQLLEAPAFSLEARPSSTPTRSQRRDPRRRSSSWRAILPSSLQRLRRSSVRVRSSHPRRRDSDSSPGRGPSTR